MEFLPPTEVNLFFFTAVKMRADEWKVCLCNALNLFVLRLGADTALFRAFG